MMEILMTNNEIKYLVFVYKGKETIPTTYKFYSLEQADEFVKVNRHTGHQYVIKRIG